MVYLSTGVFHTRSLDHIAQICIEENIKGIELSSGLNYTPNFERVLRELAGAQPFLIHNYFPAPLHPFILNLASSDGDVIKASMALCHRAIDLCQRFYVPFYSVHGGFAVSRNVKGLEDTGAQSAVQYRVGFSEAYDNLCNNVLSLSAYARERGVRILVENNAISPSNLDENDGPQLLMGDIDEIEQFLQDISDPNVGLMVDVGHVKVAAQTLGFDRDSFISRLSGHIEAFHLSDNDGVFDLNEPIKEDSWFLPHLSNFPGAYFILEPYRLTLPQITAQRSLIEKHLSNEKLSDVAFDES